MQRLHDGTINNCCKFIAGHHAVTIEVSIRISFNDAEIMKLGNVFVSPVVSRNIREEFVALRLNRARILTVN